MAELNSAKPINEVLPHGPAALMIDSLEAIDTANKTGRVLARLGRQRSFWGADGRFRRLWLIEAMAQAVALVFARVDQNEKKAELGFLIAIDQFEFKFEHQPVQGTEVGIEVKLDYDLDPVGVWTVAAELEGACLASGRFKCLVDREGALLGQH